MKIFLPFVLSWLLILTAHAQVVNIPDANFKNALLSHSPVINTNGDGEIQVSEALAFTGTVNVQLKNIADLTGIDAFTNIQGLNCIANKLTSLTLNNFPALRTVSCNGNLLTSMQLTALPLLNKLECNQNQFTSLTISNLPALVNLSTNANTILTSLNIDNLPLLNVFDCGSCFTLTSLTLNNIPSLTELSFNSCKVSSLSLTNPAILKRLYCSNNKLTSLPAGLSNIKVLYAGNNQIPVFALDNINTLDTVDISGNLCSSLSLSNKLQLKYLNCSRNPITSLTLNNLPSLIWLYCQSGQIGSLVLNGFPSLQYLSCQNNQLTNLTVSNLPSIKQLICDNNQLTSLSFINFPVLEQIQCSLNPLTSFTVNNLPLLNELGCTQTNLTTFSLPALPSLKYLSCSMNKLSSVSFINFPKLERLSVDDNKLTSLTLKNLPKLAELWISKNLFSTLTLDTLPSLYVVYCTRADSLNSITLNLPSLGRVDFDSTNLTTLDLSNTKVAQAFLINNKKLQYVNLKNGSTTFAGTSGYYFQQSTALQFVCGDTTELASINTALSTQLPGQNIAVSSLCNYTPGAYNTIKGIVRFDGNGNGCNNQDSAMYSVKIKINDGTQTGYTYTNTQGNYTVFVVDNPSKVTPVFENAYFTATPPSQTFNFTGLGNITTADFCASPNGTHPDLEIVLLPIGNARPGFDAQYSIVYRNKGNQLQSGTITLDFNDAKLNFLSAVPNISGQTPGTLSWAYAGLPPYGSRIINVTFHVEAPPVVNINDILSFTAIINPVAGDETPLDNKFTFRQVVRGSFDPNDKQVTEGSAIDISQVGEYLHYLIRFQNTGNDYAAKVVIKDSLADNLDWNTLVPIAASHPYEAVISKGNKVEFIFDNINLPGKTMNEPASHGFVAFKIKPKSSVAIGETMYNTAAIYFDFNLPVITNTVSTTVTNITKTDDAVGLSSYPNPVKDYLWFTVKPGVEIKSINLYNSIGAKVYTEVVKNPGVYNNKINISFLPTGLLFLEVISTQGRSAQKIIRIK